MFFLLGWALGEHLEWAKYSNFRVATNVPLMIHVPGLTDNRDEHNFQTTQNGSVSNALVELVDLFPTLAELTGIGVPALCPDDSSKIMLCSEGLSFVPVLKNLTLPWKRAIFSQYPRPSDTPQGNSDQPTLSETKIMGYSMQTNQQFRYTEWVQFDPKTQKANWLNVHARELYLDQNEDKNEADSPEYFKLVEELSNQLRKGWRYALPTN